MDSSLTNVEDRLSEAVEDIDTIQLVRRDSHAIISKKKFQQKVKDVETSNANRRRDYKNHRYAAVAKVHDHHHPWTFTFGMPHTDLNTSDKIYHILHNRYVHLCLSSLLLVDIIIIIVSISLEIQYLFSKISDYEAVVSDCQSALNDGENAHRCEAAEVGNESLIEIFEYLANVSLAILSLFLLESIILLVAKPYHFFSSLMYPLDLIVVVVSIALDLVFHSASQSGLLVLVRAWRFARIGHGIFAESKPKEEEIALLETLRGIDAQGVISKAFRANYRYEPVSSGHISYDLEPEIVDNVVGAVGAYLTYQSEL